MTSVLRSSSLTYRIAGALLSAALIAVLLWGCGGVGTGGTGDFTSYTESSVTGFGSVIVGDVEFDDSTASVLDDDGAAITRNGDELRLGMTLEVGSTGPVAAGGSAAAQTFRIATTALGPVEAVDTAARTVTVLGQPFDVHPSTVFGTSMHGGISSLHVGDVVAAYGFPDAASGRTLATRIESAPAARAWRLRGVVSGLDTVAHSLHIGGATLGYVGAAGVPANLADGLLVRVRLPASAGSGALAIDAFAPAASRPGDADSALVDGLVSPFVDAGSFVVNGMPVDARAAVVEPAGSTVTADAFVSLQGRIAGGTLVATHVLVEGAAAIDSRTYKVAGMVSALDTAGQTFIVRNVEVDYSGAHFVGGTASALADGVAVRVLGPLSADGTLLRATQINF